MYQQLWGITGSLVLLLMVGGCGSRKRSLSQMKEEKASALIHKTAETKQLDIITAAMITRKGYTVTYTPVNPKQPILTEDETGNRERVQNAIVTIRHDKENVQLRKSDQSQTHRIDRTQKNEAYREEKNRNYTETKRPLIPWYVWVLVVILLALGVVFRTGFKR